MGGCTEYSSQSMREQSVRNETFQSDCSLCCAWKRHHVVDKSRRLRSGPVLWPGIQIYSRWPGGRCHTKPWPSWTRVINARSVCAHVTFQSDCVLYSEFGCHAVPFDIFSIVAIRGTAGAAQYVPNLHLQLLHGGSNAKQRQLAFSEVSQFQKVARMVVLGGVRAPTYSRALGPQCPGATAALEIKK